VHFGVGAPVSNIWLLGMVMVVLWPMVPMYPLAKSRDSEMTLQLASGQYQPLRVNCLNRGSLGTKVRIPEMFASR